MGILVHVSSVSFQEALLHRSIFRYFQGSPVPAVGHLLMVTVDRSIAQAVYVHRTTQLLQSTPFIDITPITAEVLKSIKLKYFFSGYTTSPKLHISHWNLSRRT